jgi:hypothetical protein
MELTWKACTKRELDELAIEIMIIVRDELKGYQTRRFGETNVLAI